MARSDLDGRARIENAGTNRRRLFQAAVLAVGLVAMGLVVNRALDDAQHQVMPSPAALGVAAGLTLIAVLAGGRAWAALFGEVLGTRAARQRMAGTYYNSQLTKYLPIGGAVQAVSQVHLATATGVPLSRVALAFPVLAVAAVVAGVTLATGLVLASELPGWARALALAGLLAPALLDRRVLTTVLAIARRLIRRIPSPDELPTQRNILTCYAWLIVNLAGYSAAYAVLVHSLSRDVDPPVVFCAFALSWVVGYLVLPAPAGVGIREAVLVAVIPGLGAALLLAASLAHRLLSIGAELAAALSSGVASRLAGRKEGTDGSAAVGATAVRAETTSRSPDLRGSKP